MSFKGIMTKEMWKLLYKNNIVTATMCFERAGDTMWEILAKTILPRGGILKGSAKDVKEDENIHTHDPLEVTGRKRKRFNAIQFMAQFKPQRVIVESDDEDEERTSISKAKTSNNFVSYTSVTYVFAPPSLMSPFDEPIRVRGNRQSIALQMLCQKTNVIFDILPKSDLACNHMSLKSSVPLGCVPSRSTDTIKLELLPLTDGIITLDSLHINVEQELIVIEIDLDDEDRYILASLDWTERGYRRTWTW
nr:hypothetical protein Ccrd_016095 [Tanacetum cinerariifolium]